MIILVLEKYWNLKIATQLMSWVEEWIGQLPVPISKMSLHVLKSNQPAVQFYLKNNFQIVEEIPDYYDIVNADNTAYLMKRRVDKDDLTKNN